MNSEDMEWVVKECSPAVVALSMAYPRAVGIEGKPSHAYATGFVVDAAMGLILTCKHVLTCAGLATVEATFLHRPLKEKVPLKIIYIDPIHDFAFCSVDMSLLNVSPGLVELPIVPEEAEVGKQIVVIGNQRRSKLSCATGVISSINKGTRSGMDFNTFMISATDATPPGYSGGPVIDVDLHVVAMAASNVEGISYHLPLKRVTHFLKLLRAGKKIERGTIHVGLQALKDGEKHFRFRVQSCLTDKDVDIRKGDFIKRVDKVDIHSFVHFEETLDRAVGREVTVEVLRDQKKKKLQIMVDDLLKYGVTELVEFSRSVLHPIEYNLLLHYNLNVRQSRGLFVAHAGYFLKHAQVPSAAVITNVGRFPLTSATESPPEKFLAALNYYLELNQKLVLIQYRLVHDFQRVQRTVAIIDPRWFPTIHYKLEPEPYFKWQREVLSFRKPTSTSIANAQKSSKSVGFSQPKSMVEVPSATESTRQLANMGPSMLRKLVVHVRFMSPFYVDGRGVDDSNENFLKQCVGVLVDTKRGIVVCERFLIDSALGNAVLTFDGFKSVIGKVLLVHPTHLYSVIKFNTSELAAKNVTLPHVRISELLSSKEVTVSENISYYGLTLKHSKTFAESIQVTTKESVMMLSDPQRPTKFVPKNFEYFQTSLNFNGLGGFFYSKERRCIVGFNFHFLNLRSFCGVQSFPIRSTVIELIKSRCASIPLFPLHLNFLPFFEVNESYGLEDGVQQAFLKSMGEFQRTVMVVDSHLLNPSHNSGCEEGDLILKVNDQICTNLRGLNKALKLNASEFNVVDVIDQNGEKQRRTIVMEPVKPVEVDELITFSGAVFHETSIQLLNCLEEDQKDMYPVVISQIFKGSPAVKTFGSNSNRILFVSRLNGRPILNWADFAKEIKSSFSALANGKPTEDIALDIMELGEGISTVHLNMGLVAVEFWPARQLTRNLETFSWNSRDLLVSEDPIKRPPKKARVRLPRVPSGNNSAFLSRGFLEEIDLKEARSLRKGFSIKRSIKKMF